MRFRAWFGTAAGVVAALAVTGATAWACVSGASVNLSTSQAKPGQEVGIKGLSFAKVDPVEVRLGALNGAVLATLKPSPSAPFGNSINGSFVVPTSTKPGDYAVIATQTSPDGKTSNAPIRVLLTVVGEGGAAPVLGAPRGINPAARQAALATTKSGVSFGALALVALGVAGVGMFLAGIATVLSNRPGKAPVPIRQKA